MFFEFNLKQATAARKNAAACFAQGRREVAKKWVAIAKQFYGMATRSRVEFVRPEKS